MRTQRPRTAIIVLATANNLHHARGCLEGLKQHAKGFVETVVACPDYDLDLIRKATEGYDCIVEPYQGASTRALEELGRQWAVCSADQFTNEEIVVIMPIHATFSGEFTPKNFWKDGKPVMLGLSGNYMAVPHYRKVFEFYRMWIRMEESFHPEKMNSEFRKWVYSRPEGWNALGALAEFIRSAEAWRDQYL